MLKYYFESSSIACRLTEAINLMDNVLSCDDPCTITGYLSLDQALVYANSDELICVESKDAELASILLMNIAMNQLVSSTPRPIIISIGLGGPAHYVLRMLSRTCGIPFDKIESANLNTSEWKTLNAQISGLAAKPLYITNKIRSVKELRGFMQLVCERHNTTPFVLIDTLQHLYNQSREPAAEDPDDTVNSLKYIAKEYDTTVLFSMSQICDKEMLSFPHSCRMSSERTIDKILYLSSNHPCSESTTSRKINISVIKNEFGRPRDVKMALDSRYNLICHSG